MTTRIASTNPNPTYEQNSNHPTAVPVAAANSLIAELSGLSWKRISKYRKAALGLRACLFVLDDIPVLDQKAVFDAKDVRCNPVHGLAKAGKSPVYDHQVFLGHNHARFILELRTACS
jgi:hypothetical protein